jgi:hypothetical protein
MLSPVAGGRSRKLEPGAKSHCIGRMEAMGDRPDCDRW